MRYMIRPSYYTSYAVSAPTITPDGCSKQGVVFTYPPTGSPHALSSISCADAKKKLSGGGGTTPQTGGERCKDGSKPTTPNGCAPSTLQSQGAALNQQLKDKTQFVKDANQGIIDAIRGKPGAPSANPESGCNNCPDAGQWWAFLDPRQWGCKIGKLSCEAGHAAGNGFDGIFKFMKENAIPIAVVGIIGLLIVGKMSRMI